MALTLRLSDKENKILKQLLPEISTFSGKLKHMISFWDYYETEIIKLRRQLEEEQRKKDQYVAQLSEVQNALKVLKSLSDRGF